MRTLSRLPPSLIRWESSLALVVLFLALGGAAPGVTHMAAARGTPAPRVAGHPGALRGERAARAALVLWNGFPVDAHPRPIVVPAGPEVVYPPRNPHEDLATYQARWKFDQPLASDVARAQHEGLISPGAAVTALRSGMKHGGSAKRELSVRIQLGGAAFVTDRGWLRLPAWRFYFGDFRAPASVLAVMPFKSPPLRRLDPEGVTNSEDGEEAVISADRRTLRIFFVGAPAGNRPCDARYSGSVQESRHAVAFTVTEIPILVDRSIACAVPGRIRSVVVRLARPLGARVLVDSTDGGAIPVARKLTFP